MSRTFQFTVSDEIGDEIEQYIWGKFGIAPPKALGQMVLSQMSKNTITTQQFNRIMKRYGDKTIISLEAFSKTDK
jgi:hypothetical protein